jgi:hypothetical protein
MLGLVWNIVLPLLVMDQLHVCTATLEPRARMRGLNTGRLGQYRPISKHPCVVG